MKKHIRFFYPGLIALSAIAVLQGPSISLAGARKNNAGASKSFGPTVAQLAKAPPKARAMPSPFALDPDAVEAGNKLFEYHCAQCHGHGAEGGRRGPSLRVPPIEQAPPGVLFWILSNGVVRRGMPDWSKLPEPERWQIVTYLESLSPERGRDPKSALRRP